MSRLELFSIRAFGCSPPASGTVSSAGAGLSEGAGLWLAQPTMRDRKRSDPGMDRRMESLAGGETPRRYTSILLRRSLRWTAAVVAALIAGPLSAQTVVPSPARTRSDSA